MATCKVNTTNVKSVFCASADLTEFRIMEPSHIVPVVATEQISAKAITARLECEISLFSR